MESPVQLSDALVMDARVASSATERSTAGQIEFWAALGRRIDTLLSGKEFIASKQRGDFRRLSERLAETETNLGQQRVRAVLDARPFPHFEDVPGEPDLLTRIDADGTRTVGRFVDRRFVETKKGGN